MDYQIGDVVYYKTLGSKSEYYGKITQFNNGYYTVESYNGFTKIVSPSEIINKK